MTTERLTTAQALVKWMCAQHVAHDDGTTEPVFAGVFGIFGHGNVTCLAEALERVQDQLPTWRGQNEQGMALAGVAYAKAKRGRRIMVATSLGRSGRDEHGDGCWCGHGQPPAAADPLR